MPLTNAQDYPLWLNGLLFAIGAGLVWMAGTWLVNSVDKIAAKTGLSQAFAGMLLLGTLTSLPEIANVTAASWSGSPGLAMNNLLGSASINILLLALVDAFVGRDALTSVVTRPVTMMQATLCMLVLSLVAIAITVGDIAIFGVGLWSTIIFVVSIGAFWMASRYEGEYRWKAHSNDGENEAKGEKDEVQDDSESSLASLIWKAAIASAIILVAGYTLSQTGEAIATQTGLGEGLVGFALLGIATSLPELSTITAALKLRRYEMAIGEVLGTNFVNMALILLADVVFVAGPVINEAGQFEIISALLGVLLTGIVLVGLLERRNLTIFKMGYDSFAVIVVFVAGLVVLSQIG